MTTWQEGHRPPTLQEAEEYLKAHPEEGDDFDAFETCQDVVAREGRLAHGMPASDGGVIKPSPYPKPPDELLEEKGAD
jgi:hypothetical protein